MTQSELLNMQQMAKHLGVTPATIAKWRDTGKIPKPAFLKYWTRNQLADILRYYPNSDAEPSDKP